MAFQDEIRTLATRIEKQKGGITTEEACKNAFVMPFLKTLDYQEADVPCRDLPLRSCRGASRKRKARFRDIERTTHPIFD